MSTVLYFGSVVKYEVPSKCQNSVLSIFVNGAFIFANGAFIFVNGASVFVNGAFIFSRECTIRMIWGLTALKHCGTMTITCKL